MKQIVQEAFHHIGIDSFIQTMIPVSGGSTTDAYKIVTNEGRYFLKTRTGSSADFFKKELNNLKFLRQTNTVALPEPFGEWYHPETRRGFLVLEWIEGHANEKTEAQLGHDLALLHLSYGSAFGNQEDNYLGALPQPNEWSRNWISFYRDQRIQFQVKLGKKRGVIQGKRLRKFEKLIERMDSWLSHQPKPSPLHGDLWSGNWIAGPKGTPYLIDPACYYGDHELDLAFTECFGGFSPTFYHAYQERFPLSPTYQDRKPLYMLLLLLVHLNLFGEGYGLQVDTILDYYVGS